MIHFADELCFASCDAFVSVSSRCPTVRLEYTPYTFQRLAAKLACDPLWSSSQFYRQDVSDSRRLLSQRDSATVALVSAGKTRLEELSPGEACCDCGASHWDFLDLIIGDSQKDPAKPSMRR